MSPAQGFNQDFLDLLQAFAGHGVEYVVVGAPTLAVHGVPRATGDLDLLMRPSPDNAACVMAALREFGAPVDAHGVTAEDLARPGTVYKIGLPPRRIAVLTQICGVSFEQAHASCVDVDLAGTATHFPGREALLQNKRAAGRDKDLLDLKLLERGPVGS